MSADRHHHDHSHLSTMEVRVRAIQSLLEAKGYIDPAAIDALIELYEHVIGPQHGARVVARAWTSPDFAELLFADAPAALQFMGYKKVQGDNLVALKNTPQTHNMVVCTLCSCYPWAVLGLPPGWYKSAPYRSKAVADPRGVLADFGVSLPDETNIEVYDSTAELRYIVVPMRPEGTDGWDEDALAAIISRDSMIGTGLPSADRPAR